MTGRRVHKAQDLIREEVARLLAGKVKDPRISAVSVTGVKMSPDLKRAVVMFSVFDDTMDRENILKGLNRAAGFIQREVGRNLRLKFTPEIRFEFDRSLEYAQHMDQVLNRVVHQENGMDENDGTETEKP